VTDRVFVLGAGRAGLGLARALRLCGITVLGVHGRRARREGEIDVTAGLIPPAIADASAILVAVRDGDLARALQSLSTVSLAADSAVLHLSGATDPEGLETIRGRGIAAGTFHPLVPLAGPDDAPARLRGAYIGLDGDQAARAAGVRLATALGAHTLDIPAGAKPIYHAAAVLASNFPVVLIGLAEEMLASAGVESGAARGAVRALLAGASANLGDRSAAEALTGPVARGDGQTVSRHLDALATGPAEIRNVYIALSAAAAALAATGSAQVAGLAEVQRIVRQAQA